jgi:hypothetical protein
MAERDTRDVDHRDPGGTEGEGPEWIISQVFAWTFRGLLIALALLIILPWLGLGELWEYALLAFLSLLAVVFVLIAVGEFRKWLKRDELSYLLSAAFTGMIAFYLAGGV